HVETQLQGPVHHVGPDLPGQQRVQQQPAFQIAHVRVALDQLVDEVSLRVVQVVGHQLPVVVRHRVDDAPVGDVLDDELAAGDARIQHQPAGRTRGGEAAAAVGPVVVGGQD